MEPDLALLERWRAGDQGAGQDLFARHFADIYRFFEHKLRGEADDLAQRTFLACVQAKDQFRGQSSFRTYLFTIARHELYRHLRRMPRGEHLDPDVTSIGEVVTSIRGKLGRSQEIEALRDALSELPAEQQLLLELHYWHELDAAALAEVFDSNAGAIRVRLLRARKALRARLAEVTPAGVGEDRLAAALSRPDPDE